MDINEGVIYSTDLMRLLEDLKTLRELADLATPKKPRLNYKPTFFERLFGAEETYTCPCCGNVRLIKQANDGQDIDYCWNCGKKLDWVKDE